MTQRQALLEGNGVGLVKELLLAARVQSGLERLYRLDRIAHVEAFMQVREGEREELLLRESDTGDLEISLRVPALAQAKEDSVARTDMLCQIIEGVSHFVYVTCRAAMQKRTTQLELELQAEVDKYVVLAASSATFTVERSQELRRALYERVAFAHAPGTEHGERYRIANEAAARFVRKLEPSFTNRARTPHLRATLRTFFHENLEQKLRMARAA